MISPEMIRRYPFFAGLSTEQIEIIAKEGEEMEVPEGHVFHRGNDALHRFYIVVSGEIGIFVERTARGVKHGIADQLTGHIQTEDVVISYVRPGEIFGWSSLLPPYSATAGSKTMTDSKVIAFNTDELLRVFETNCQFGYVMAQKLAQVIHTRLQDRRAESVSDRVE